MKIKLFFLLCLCLLLCGCSLAAPDGGEESIASPDRLIGVYITDTYIDAFDMEAYFEDNAEKLLNGGEVDASSYQQRIYAVKTGSDEHIRYSFEEQEGFPFFMVTVTEENGNCSYLESEGFSDVASAVGGNESLTGTLHYEYPAADAFYLNPVYETGDGQVYLLPGSGVSFSGDGGGSFTHTLEEKYTATENGETSERSFAVTVTLEALPPVDFVTVKQFGANDALLASEEITAGSVPESIHRAPGLEYIIVESHGPEGVRREFTDEFDYCVSFLLSGEKGVLMPHVIALD